MSRQPSLSLDHYTDNFSIRRNSLSWSDTAASTVGRLIGRHSSPLPSHVPLIPFLPFAKRKSLAGYLAAALTGFCICLGFWWNGRHEGWQPRAGDAGWWFLDFQGSETGNGFGRIDVAGKPLGLWLSALVLGFGGATVEAIGMYRFSFGFCFGPAF